MHLVTHSVIITAQPVDAWELYSNNTKWPSWYPVMTYVEWPKFEEGIKGTIKIEAGPAVKCTLKLVAPYQEFLLRIGLPFAWLDVYYIVEQLEDRKVRVTNRAEINGLFFFLSFLTAGHKVRKFLVNGLERFATIAEDYAKKRPRRGSN